MIVVDASVVVPMFKDEPDSAVARDFVRRYGQLHAPDLLRLEVASALLKSARRRAFDGTQIAPSVARLTLPVFHLKPGIDYLDDAVIFARTQGGSVYDGVYAAMARRLDVPLATADRALASVARGAGIAIVTLTDR